MDQVIALVALTAMEIVLGIDNIVFIAILTDRLPAHQQSQARRLGLLLALIMRVGLLSAIKWIMTLTQPIFEWTSLGIPGSIFPGEPGSDALKEAVGVSWRDLILLGGGLFLIGKTVHEVHVQIEGDHTRAQPKTMSFSAALIQIMLLDLVFSLDSVITAVGMADHLEIMVAAVILAVGVMVAFADRISRFVSRHPTLKMLALSFLLLIGVMLVAEGIGTHINKGYIYFAMAFSLVVEVLNIRVRAKHRTAPAAASDD